MEEGTGLSLYILVGSIMFGLFAVMVATFGTELQAQTSNIVACVQSYVLNEPSDCGESESNTQPEHTPAEISFGPTGSDWESLTVEEREAYRDEFKNTLREEIPGIENTNYYRRLNSYGQNIKSGLIYGVFNESGELVKTYSIGQTYDSKQDGSKTIRVNDMRIVPEYIQQKSTRYYVDSRDELYNREGYTYLNEEGIYDYYYIFK